jgi:hypothetical protein
LPGPGGKPAAKVDQPRQRQANGPIAGVVKGVLPANELIVIAVYSDDGGTTWLNTLNGYNTTQFYGVDKKPVWILKDPNIKGPVRVQSVTANYKPL